jgi:hypothetical protein
MMYRVTAAALIMSMPLISSSDWLEGVNAPTERNLSANDKREAIPVSPRTSTILFATANYSKPQAEAFIEIIYRESRFDPTATNSESGAYGLGQALPPEKMDSVGADWRTNLHAQLEWVALYIESRYGNPMSALEHHDQYGWY